VENAVPRFVDPHSLDGARSEVLDQNIRARDKAIENSNSVGFAQIQDDGSLVSIEARENRRHAAPARANRSQSIAAPGPLDLDHVRALIRKDRSRERSRGHRGQIYNADAI
jgi:hypothetical protein